MDHFTALQGEVLLIQRGVFRVTTLAMTESGELFAKRGPGYIRLRDHGETSIPAVHWLPTGATPLHHYHQGKLMLGEALPKAPVRQVKPVTRAVARKRAA